MDLIGVDIGGTKVSVCLGDADGTILAHKRIETASLGGPETGLPKIVDVMGHLLRDENVELNDIRAIGLAVPGPVSTKTERMLTPPNLPNWIDVPIVQYLREKLGCPVFMDNDANAGALAEWMFGGAKHVDNLVYLTMSTGMGGGLIIDGKLHQGRTDTAGEVGHFILDPKGPKCACGLTGCFEAFCGGAAVAERESIDLKELITRVKKSEPKALKVWEDYIDRLAQGIGILIQTLNPDAIILGTIATHNKELVMNPLKQALPHFAWGAPLKYCRIEPSRLGSAIGKLGALALAIRGLVQSSS